MDKRRAGKIQGCAGKKAGRADTQIGAEGRDAMGRRWRAERRRIEEFKARRGPLTASGHHPVVSRIAEMAGTVRGELGLSLHAAAELCELTAAGLAAFESRKGGGRNDTLGFICRGYGMPVSSFLLRIEMENAARH